MIENNNATANANWTDARNIPLCFFLKNVPQIAALKTWKAISAFWKKMEPELIWIVKFIIACRECTIKCDYNKEANWSLEIVQFGKGESIPLKAKLEGCQIKLILILWMSGEGSPYALRNNQISLFSVQLLSRSSMLVKYCRSQNKNLGKYLSPANKLLIRNRFTEN